MGRSVLFAVLLLCAPAVRSAAQSAATREASAAMQHGDFSSAEKILRGEVQSHPGDAWALSLLGVALDNQKKLPEAEEFHRRAVAQSPNSADVLNNYGTHLWSAGQYDKAETVFASALTSTPAYFLVLYNLGVMATYTGHYERAREVLETALRQQPKNVDVLYRLACAEEAARQWETAAMHLAQAAGLDPRRADVQKMLAVTTSDLGALDDAAAAWDRYLELQPGDDLARRERGYTAARMGKIDEATADLEWFLERHPDDAVAHYELAQTRRGVDMTEALQHLDRALAIDPNYAPAQLARGTLYYQQGKPELAVGDLEKAAVLQPLNAAILDSLGQAYQALDRPADAVRALRQAAELAPNDSKIQLHFGRALADAGHIAESKAVMDRFRKLGPEKQKGVPAGLVVFLSLTPEQRRADYKARVENTVREHPEDAVAQVDYLKLMIEEGNTGEVSKLAQRIAGMKPGAAILADAGHALLEADSYALAKGLLEQAAAAGGSGGDLQLDLALAAFQVPGSAPDRAAATLGQAVNGATDRPGAYLRATAVLVKLGRATDALRLIDEGARGLPDNREILLMRATTLEFARHPDDAAALLKQIEGRWPEWPAARLANGILLYTHQHYEEARQALDTAVALGARRPEAYFYLADCNFRSGKERSDAAEAAIQEALKLSPGDPWILALAGRIAAGRGQLQLAAERARAAARQHPGGAADVPPYPSNLYQGSLLKEKPPRGPAATWR